VNGNPTLSYWLIVNREMEPLTCSFGRGEVLPVFGFRDEAVMFVRLGAPGRGWRVRQFSCGELLSTLFARVPGSGGVVLDPLPDGVPASRSVLDHEEFMDFLDERSRLWASIRASRPGLVGRSG
jgi:hypothetical protein